MMLAGGRAMGGSRREAASRDVVSILPQVASY